MMLAAKGIRNVGDLANLAIQGDHAIYGILPVKDAPDTLRTLLANFYG